MKLTVLKLFRDIADGRVYHYPGDVIDIQDKARIDSILERGLAKSLADVATTKEVVKQAENAVNIYQSAALIKENVDNVSDVAELERALADEKKQEKPRKGVISIIEDRIKELS